MHDGWKFPKQFYAKKDSDNAQNWILFNYHFKDELQRKYQTSRTCSPVEAWLPPAQKKLGKKPLTGPGQGEIPRVPSISDTLAKFSRALHGGELKDKNDIDDILDSGILHIHSDFEHVEEVVHQETNVEEIHKQVFDVPEAKAVDPDALSWE